MGISGENLALEYAAGGEMSSEHLAFECGAALRHAAARVSVRRQYGNVIWLDNKGCTRSDSPLMAAQPASNAVPASCRSVACSNIN